MRNKIEKLLDTKIPLIVFCISNGIAAIFTQSLGLPRFLFMLITVATAFLISAIVCACILGFWVITSKIKEINIQQGNNKILIESVNLFYNNTKMILICLFLTSFLLNLCCFGLLYKTHKNVNRIEKDMYSLHDGLKRGRIAELQIIDINFEKRLIRLERQMPNLGELPVLDKDTTIGQYENALNYGLLGE